MRTAGYSFTAPQFGLLWRKGSVKASATPSAETVHAKIQTLLPPGVTAHRVQNPATGQSYIQVLNPPGEKDKNAYRPLWNTTGARLIHDCESGLPCSIFPANYRRYAFDNVTVAIFNQENPALPMVELTGVGQTDGVTVLFCENKTRWRWDSRPLVTR